MVHPVFELNWGRRSKFVQQDNHFKCLDHSAVRHGVFDSRREKKTSTESLSILSSEEDEV